MEKEVQEIFLPLAEGIKIYESEVKKAYEYFYYHATQYDDLLANFREGESHYYGRGVKRNLEKAFILFKKCAEVGVIDAMYYVGKIYLMDTPHYSRYRRVANKWLSEAALLGFRDAPRLWFQGILDKKFSVDLFERCHG